MLRTQYKRPLKERCMGLFNGAIARLNERLYGTIYIYMRLNISGKHWNT